jgi:hypothetical protein
VPGSGLGARLESIFHAAEAIVALCACVAGAIALTTRLAPDKGVDKRGACVGGGVATEARAVDVAPVAPFLADARDAVAARVDDGLARHACCDEFGRDELDVLFLVLCLVVLAVRCIGEFTG